MIPIREVHRATLVTVANPQRSGRGSGASSAVVARVLAPRGPSAGSRQGAQLAGFWPVPSREREVTTRVPAYEQIV